MDVLKYCRKRIDDIDRKIVDLLLSRFKLAKKIGNYKTKNLIEINNKKRELEVLKNVKKKSNKYHKKFIIGIFKKIIGYSKRIQSK